MQDESYPALKRCCACRLPKPFDAFGRDVSRPDALKADCKECRRSATQRNKGSIAVRAKRYRQTLAPVLETAKRRIRRQRVDPIVEAERLRLRRDKHRDHINALRRQRRAASATTRIESDRKWRAANPDKVRALNCANQQRRRAAEGAFVAEEWLALCNRYDQRCLCCGRSDVNLTADHVIPISRGGDNWIANIQPLCLSCNTSKGTKIIDYRPVFGPPLA